MIKTIDDTIDELELKMQDYEPVDCPLAHTFTENLYTRTIFMPSGTLITSCIHKTQHQFAILAGSALVKIRTGEWERLCAPCAGITEPGTRRILFVEEDCVWMTMHSTDIQPKDNSDESIAEAVELIEKKILEPRENKLLGGVIKNNIIANKIIKH